MGQKFIAREPRKYKDGSTGYAPGGPMDCLGPWAKVTGCRIAGTSLRLTCYATGYADTFFSIPACTRYKGRHVGGYFTTDADGNPEFRPYDRYKAALPMLALCASN